MGSGVSFERELKKAAARYGLTDELERKVRKLAIKKLILNENQKPPKPGPREEIAI